MKTISAERFEARCLTIIDELRRRRQPVVITRREDPWRSFFPLRTEGMRSLAASLETSRS
jgi:hypothetical protein